MVGKTGLEPATPCSQSRCATTCATSRNWNPRQDSNLHVIQLTFPLVRSERVYEGMELSMGIKPISLAWKARAQSIYQPSIKNLFIPKRNSPRCSVLLFAQWGFTGSTLSLFYANKPQYNGDPYGT